ncbi:endonuclease/exonuclease/phosphatase family protein [Nitratifractor sp.]|uniref:endonuclease/exonuclease/phosphatase family protein n=1 Tax=Nitratifractor sp. TaxID=2268144 RepID=UPI0026008C53|nr:endonuclease/exonuclease/phosphatase family protein [Nitratifractor sp.]
MFFIRDIQASCHHAKDPLESLPESFGLLVWNVNKSTDTKHYRRLFEMIKDTWNIHLILIQEARMRPPSAPFLLPNFSYCSAPNLQQGSLRYGLLTASTPTALEAIAIASHAKEAIIGPGKGSLITRYGLTNGETLTLVNLHAINFRAARIYEKEMRRLQEYLRNITGPMIVAGDFNSWSEKRMHVLENFRQKLALKRVPFSSEKIKTFRGHPLDHILYRGLDCKRHFVPDFLHDSDHTPLMVEFGV